MAKHKRSKEFVNPTLEQLALDAGLPSDRAKKVAIYESGPEGLPGKFFTAEELIRRYEIADEAKLRWLFNLDQESRGSKSPIVNDLLAIIVGFRTTSPNGRDVSADATQPTSESEAWDYVEEFLRNLTHFVERRGTGIEWPFTFGGIVKTLSWGNFAGGGASSHFRADDWRAAFDLWAIYMVDKYGLRIRRCLYKECRRLFVGDTADRQKFCSKKCAQVDRQQRFRAKKEHEGQTWKDYRRQGRESRVRVQIKRKKLRAEAKRRKTDL